MSENPNKYDTKMRRHPRQIIANLEETKRYFLRSIQYGHY
jgi:hypothetical protein